MHVYTVAVPGRDPSCFSDLVGEDRWRFLTKTFRTGVGELGRRTVWNVNTTAAGGGVAEMLRSLVAYARGAGADVRWVVISPPAEIQEFFTVTKRIHNMLHGFPGDGLGLGRRARAAYVDALEPSAGELQSLTRRGDVVILHDPQTAGLVPSMRAAGLNVIWRCHVGADNPNGEAHEVWDFLRPFVEQADRYVFSRSAHIWSGLDPSRTSIVPPSIDPFSAKNQPLSNDQVDAILKTTGAIGGTPAHAPTFNRQDRSCGRVRRRVQMLGAPSLKASGPLVTQVSRWDALKDPLGVMSGFARHVLPVVPDAQLALVGPETAAVADDPEGAQVLRDCQDAWSAFPGAVRERVSLICLPMSDLEENAVIVNAIQRHSSVVVQKSTAEGFGLTVSEAMWKARPVIASRVGGIADQIEDGDSGILLEDPGDLRQFGDAVLSVLRSPDQAGRMGERARERVIDQFLATRSLVQYAAVIGGFEPEALDAAA